MITLHAVNEHQPAGDYTGVELHQLLSANGVAQGKELRGKHISEYLVVSATDGYRVVFALPELDPQFAQRKIVLAWQKDGHPLPDAEGPLRIIIPDEKHPTRWIRQVRSIRVLAAPDHS
jgi:DMSO/TMAO reductase YedYZ molybdopterin-dependent catalytic subunit